MDNGVAFTELDEDMASGAPDEVTSVSLRDDFDGA